MRNSQGYESLSQKDFTDDRLGDEQQWDAFESFHNTNMVHVYGLNTQVEAILYCEELAIY